MLEYKDTFEYAYNKLVLDILNNGYSNENEKVRTVYADGTPAYTKSIEGVLLKIHPEDTPILKSKFVGSKWAFTEMEWIWQEMSNDVKWLHDNGNVTIWDSWRDSEGTIGRGYGYQLKNKHRMVDGMKLDQVEYVLHQLQHNPSSRRIMTTLWDVNDLDYMELEPCVWSTHWSVQGGKLNLHVKQRSADIILGNPFNTLQYHALHKLMAEETGLEHGTMYWCIDNAHIYDRHFDLARKQVTKPLSSQEVAESKPKLILPEGKGFFNRRLSQAKIVDYKHNGIYRYEVAI